MPNSLFHYLHAAVIPFRAAENAVPIVWSECTSLSAIYDGYGRRIARAPEHMIGHVHGIVALRERRTFFTLAGDYFAYLCAGVLVLAAGTMVRRKLQS